MGIKPKFNPGDFKRNVNQRMDRIDAVIISRLQYIGETFVNNARKNNTYRDITGNLRSSIGYIVMKDGKTIHEDYQQSDKGSDKATGIETGKGLINKLKSSLGKGYVLIVVAGMDYAASVESKGKDVLTASSIMAKKQLTTAVQDFKNIFK
jgi:hypothetical protein